MHCSLKSSSDVAYGSSSIIVIVRVVVRCVYLRNDTPRPTLWTRLRTSITVLSSALVPTSHIAPSRTATIHAANRYLCQAFSIPSGISPPSLTAPIAADQPIVVFVPLNDPLPTPPLNRASSNLSLHRVSRTPTHYISLHLPDPSPSTSVNRL